MPSSRTARSPASSCSSAARRRSISPRRSEAAGVPILGTTPDAIDLAEDRDRFAKLLKKLKLRQPENGIARSAAEARKIAAQDRLPGRHPPVLCAGRPRHGDRARRSAARPLYHRGGGGFGRQPGAHRQLSLQCHRGRCRCDLRRQGRLRRRRHGAYRGSRHPFRRQRLRAAALFAESADHRRDRSARRANWRWRSSVVGLDECAVRRSRTTSSMCSRSTRAPRAPCPSSPR